LNYSRLHFLVDHHFNLFSNLGLLVENAVIADDAPVPRVVSHGGRGADNIVQVLRLIHLRHELIELVIAVGLDLFQKVVHFQSLPIT
jgi:hypothetical protein